MFGFFKKPGAGAPNGETKKEKEIQEKVKELNKELHAIPVTESLEENVNVLKTLFADVGILRLRFLETGRGKAQKYCVAYCDGVVNSSIINENIIKPLLLSEIKESGDDLADGLMQRVLTVNGAEKTNDYEKIVGAITYGDTILFIDGVQSALLLETKGFKLRSIEEPESERSLNGPREGFTESLLINLSLIRRKVRSHELKIRHYTFGERTKTQAGICYIEGIVKKEVLDELCRRLDKIHIDGVLDTNYITELIRDLPWSPFRTTGYTERPDVVVAKLLEGRVAVFLDGSPEVMTVPYLFIENFQSSEDYYLNFLYSSFSRMLRIVGFFITVTLPGFYVAMAGFHHEVMPTAFLLNVASERNGVPFPAPFEAFVLLVVFDLLRETGIRMPSSIGQALSIVGALVIGQAAVEAKLVASPMIIVIATTGITSLLIPKMNASLMYARVLVLVLSTLFGFTGTISGISIITIHILNLRSFGIPQVPVRGGLQFQKLKDTAIRAPWWEMRLRPRHLAEDRVRLKIYEKDNG